VGKIINWFVALVSKTLGEWHWPWVDKQFKIEDYFDIEVMIRNLQSPFVVGLVKTNGHGSNLLINFAQKMGGKNKGAVTTHALAHIGIYKDYKHRVVEAIGEGIREVPLLKAIGQRDIVILRRPDHTRINSVVCAHAIDYLKDMAKRDAENNITYDNDHDYSNDMSVDCIETVYQALTYGFEKEGLENPIKLVDRAGKMTSSPADFELSDLFITIYDSRIGFI